MSRDVLEEILSTALREGAIGQGSIADFAAGLRDRARIVLDERLRPLRERVATLEKENDWRASAIASLTDENGRVVDENRRVKDENARVRDEIGRLKDENRRVKEENAGHIDEVGRLKDESRRVQDECRRLKEEIEGVRAEWRTASSAHDRLLAHHRAVVRGVADSLVRVAALPVWKRAEARARLADLADALGRDTA